MQDFVKALVRQTMSWPFVEVLFFAAMIAATSLAA